MTEPTQTPEQLIDEYLEVWNERDYARCSDVVSESFVRVSPAFQDGGEGPEALKEQIRRLEDGFSDFQVTIHERLVGDGIAMSEGTFTGTHDGEFNGVPPTEREVEIQFMDKLRFGENGVDEHRTYYNRQEMVEQLGLADE